VTAGEADRVAVRRLLDHQRLGVLSTQGGGQAYASLIAFAPSDDGRFLLFATPRATLKFRNLAADPRAAVLLDDRNEGQGALGAAAAVTATGRAEEVPDAERESSRRAYLARHPHLAGFLNDPGCALMRLRVEAWTLVRQFQEVSHLPGEL
jgi:nitroimidazol reductase NimA-like FMN-containing flavoprotein (pyridoxamine 5'-phosphate oxidase superfamily)